jgi:hypothetical protein
MKEIINIIENQEEEKLQKIIEDGYYINSWVK